MAVDAITAFGITKLNDANYYTWSARVRMALEFKGLDSAIESDNGPSSSNEKTISKESDKSARAFIGMCVTDSYLPYILKAQTAKEAWQSLEKVFKAKGMHGA